MSVEKNLPLCCTFKCLRRVVVCLLRLYVSDAEDDPARYGANAKYHTVAKYNSIDG